MTISEIGPDTSWASGILPAIQQKCDERKKLKLPLPSDITLDIAKLALATLADVALHAACTVAALGYGAVQLLQSRNIPRNSWAVHAGAHASRTILSAIAVLFVVVPSFVNPEFALQAYPSLGLVTVSSPADIVSGKVRQALAIAKKAWTTLYRQKVLIGVAVAIVVVASLMRKSPPRLHLALPQPKPKLLLAAPSAPTNLSDASPRPVSMPLVFEQNEVVDQMPLEIPAEAAVAPEVTHGWTATTLTIGGLCGGLTLWGAYKLRDRYDFIE